MAKDLRIVFSGTDYRSVDAAVRRVMDAARSTGNEFRGPVPLLPVLTADRAVIADNRRSLAIVAPNHKMMPALSCLDLPSTVSVEMSA